MLADVNEQPLSLLRRSGLFDQLGSGNVFASLEGALAALQPAAMAH